MNWYVASASVWVGVIVMVILVTFNDCNYIAGMIVIVAVKSLDQLRSSYFSQQY
jgi:hypothetical protein